MCLFFFVTALHHCLPHQSCGQNTFVLDSLNRSVQQAPNDTARIAALCRLSEELLVTNGDSLARLKANDALHLAEQLAGGVYRGYTAYYRTLALQALCGSYRFSAEESHSLGYTYFQKAMEEARRIPEERTSLAMQALVQNTWFNGLRFRLHQHRKSDKPIGELRREAEALLQTQQNIAEKLQSNALRGRILLNRAIVLNDTLAQRLLLNIESVRLYEQSSDSDGLINALLYLGFHAELIGDYSRAVLAYKRAVHLQKLTGLLGGLSVAYQSMGDIYLKLSDTTKALENYRSAEVYSERYAVPFNHIEFLFQIGSLYRAIGSSDKARGYFERAILLSHTRKDQYDLLRSAKLYRLQGNCRAGLEILPMLLRELERLSPQLLSYEVFQECILTHKEYAAVLKATQPALSRASFDAAIRYAKQNLDLLLNERLRISSAERFLETYTLLYELSKEAGDSKNALRYYEEHEHWNKKVFTNETYRVIAAMESRAVVEAAEAKVETLEANNRLQRTVGWATGIMVLGLTVIVGLLTWRYTERKRTIAHVQQQNDRLTALNIEKNEIMGMVSHDLKNPIGAVAGFAEILRDPMLEEETKVLMLDQLSLVSNRMLELVKNILDLNQIEDGGLLVNIVSMDIVSICRMTVDLYRQPAATKDITLHFMAETESLALADEQMIHQVVDNILSNAVKYTPRGKQAWVRVLKKNSSVRIEVENEGEGISPDDMKKLFGKFARLTARPTGGEHSTGLGLSIVKKMVEAMNGKVWCESELGKGATFIVELPKSA